MKDNIYLALIVSSAIMSPNNCHLERTEMTSKGIIKGVFYTVSIIIIIMSIAVLTTIPAGGVAGIIIGFILLFGIRRALRGLGYHSLARRLV